MFVPIRKKTYFWVGQKKEAIIQDLVLGPDQSSEYTIQDIIKFHVVI